LPGEGAACAGATDCTPPLVCVSGSCTTARTLAIPIEKPASAALPAPPERPFTIDIDAVVYASSAQAVGYPLGYYSPLAGSAAVLTPSATFESTILGLRYAVRRLRFEAEIPFAVWWGADSNASAAFGNLAFGAYYEIDGASVHFQAGAIVSLPTSPQTEGTVVSEQVGANVAVVVAGRTPLQEVLFSRGYDRAWLWTSYHSFTPLAPSVRLFSDEHQVFQHATEAVLAPIIGSDTGGSAGGVVMQASEELGAHMSLFRAGARAEVVAVAGSGNPFAYVTVMPFAGIGGKYGFVDVGALFNLTDPLGYTSSESSGPNWALRVRGGLRF
jgi:hypothetical protein